MDTISAVLAVIIVIVLIVILVIIIVNSSTISNISSNIDDTVPQIEKTAEDVDVLINDLTQFGTELRNFLSLYNVSICTPEALDNCPDELDGDWSLCPAICGFIKEARIVCSNLPDNEFCKDIIDQIPDNIN